MPLPEPDFSQTAALIEQQKKIPAARVLFTISTAGSPCIFHFRPTIQQRFRPPLLSLGTGKSTLVAAMANYLEYNLYDLELTTVRDNIELRRLLIDTTSKSIIIIEDIDCSIDLSGKRETKSSSSPSNKAKDNNDDLDGKKTQNGKEEEVSGNINSQVTLSGLLNFINGLWSACGEEQIIVFTTNYAEKLDPTLIWRGRMDMHIEMSYCSFEGFKVLAKNYLELYSHPLLEDIHQLTHVSQITPEDVAEKLISKSSILTAEGNAEACLSNLIGDLRRS